MLPLIDPVFAGSAVFRRPVVGADNTVTWTVLGDTPVVPSIAGATGDPVLMQAGTLFVPRELDRQAGDRLTYNGVTMVLTGSRRGDQDHPITGDDFGWIAHAFSISGAMTVALVEPGNADSRDVNGVLDADSAPGVDIAECMLRPLSATEQVDLTQTTMTMWECLVPPHTAAMNAGPNHKIRHGAATYDIIAGAQPVYELNGAVHHVKLLCDNRNG